MIKWRDAYTSDKTTLKHIKNNLGRVAICETRGKVVYKNRIYTVIEQHSTKGVDCGNDYFVIPTALVIKKRK